MTSLCVDVREINYIKDSIVLNIICLINYCYICLINKSINYLYNYVPN